MNGTRPASSDFHICRVFRCEAGCNEPSERPAMLIRTQKISTVPCLFLTGGAISPASPKPFPCFSLAGGKVILEKFVVSPSAFSTNQGHWGNPSRLNFGWAERAG